MSRDETERRIVVLRQMNVEQAIREGPGLRYSTQTWVEARDRVRGWVRLGGLGGMGVGTMWFRDDGSCSKKVGYEDAPEEDSTGGFGTNPLGF